MRSPPPRTPSSYTPRLSARASMQRADVSWEDVRVHAAAIASELNGGVPSSGSLRVYASDLKISLCMNWSKFKAFGRWCSENLHLIVPPAQPRNGRSPRRRGEAVVTTEELERAVAAFLTSNGLLIEGMPTTPRPTPRGDAAAARANARGRSLSSTRASPQHITFTAAMPPSPPTEVQRLARGIFEVCAKDDSGKRAMIRADTLGHGWLAGTCYEAFGAWFTARACVVAWIKSATSSAAGGGLSAMTKLPLSRSELKSAVAAFLARDDAQVAAAVAASAARDAISSPARGVAEAVAMRLQALAASVAVKVEGGVLHETHSGGEASPPSPAKLRVLEKAQYRAVFKWRKPIGIRALPSMDAPFLRDASDATMLLAPMKSHERIFVDEAVVTVCHFAQNSAVKLKRSGSSSPPTPETFEVRWLRLGRLEGYTVAGEGGWIFDRNPITGRQMLEPVVTASEKASASIVES